MSSGVREYQSEFVRKFVFQGRAEGRVEGRVEGRAETLLAVLATRNIEVPDDVRARITGCTDAEQLDIWIRLDPTRRVRRYRHRPVRLDIADHKVYLWKVPDRNQTSTSAGPATRA